MKIRLRLGVLTGLVLSFAGLGLRLWYLNTGIDADGLLITGHPGVWLTYFVCVLALANALFTVLPLYFQRRYDQLFPAAPAAAVAVLAAGGAIGWFVWHSITTGIEAPMVKYALIVGAAAVVCSVMLGFCRLKGRRPGFLPQTVFTLFFLMYLYTQYRAWSSETQLGMYLFPVLAVVSTTLSCYHRAALDAGLTGVRSWLLTTLAAVFCNCLSLADSSHWVLHLGMLVYQTVELLSISIPAGAAESTPSQTPAQTPEEG